MAVLLAAMIVSLSWLSPCGGWDASADARTACCAGAEHQCADLADECCAAGEQRQHGESSGPALHGLPSPLPVAFPPLSIAQGGTSPVGRLIPSHVPLGSPPDPHLLLSVFLI